MKFIGFLRCDCEALRRNWAVRGVFAGWLAQAAVSKEHRMKVKLIALSAAATLALAGAAYARPGATHGSAPQASATGAAHANSISPTTNAAPTGNANGAANAAQTRQTTEGMNGPAQTGQPGAECGSATAPTTPGNAASAPGSAFNPNGNAGTHYAGEQPQNSRNTASVSQYDSACAHQPTPH
jgi:hypothetical protein